ncbi:hypothetical protein PHMEG_00012809 [Phytophthora megakarya]|uniref:Uncharacterized protein n=1 Tax=Phytophthora megakarya TaxID=4795 RepID=A0A225W7T4_9STRA|nr:hypothetical protein PHMEG_00012809 [Phytophthora megakarya]
MQQSNNAPFLRFPPVCRGLWEFSSLARGLTLVRCRPADLWNQVQAQEANVSFTSFSERNTLRAATQHAVVNAHLASHQSLDMYYRPCHVKVTSASIPDIILVFIKGKYNGLAPESNTQWLPSNTGRDGTPTCSIDRSLWLASVFRLLHRLNQNWECERIDQLHEYASKLGLTCPTPSTQDDAIDANSVKFLTELASRSALSLPEFARRFRGQSNTDARPNKSLYEVPVPTNSSRHEVYHSWNKIVRVGVQPRWSNDKPHTEQHQPPNRNSAATHGDAVRRHIGKGQRDGRFLVFHKRVLSLWPELFKSPIGVVDKAGGDTRTINDYSFPNMGSVMISPIGPTFQPLHITLHAISLGVYTCCALNVSGAFRHVPIHEDAVHSFVFMFDDYIIIDLSCGFGSQTFYPPSGCVINDLYESTPVHDDTVSTLGGLHGNVWCDDHTCVEVNHEPRCDDANIALRHAMTTVLVPMAINDKKFKSWSTQNKAIGLLWDTTAGTVSIPTNKLDKATEQIAATLQSSHASKSGLNKLLGVFVIWQRVSPLHSSHIETASTGYLPLNLQVSRPLPPTSTWMLQRPDGVSLDHTSDNLSESSTHVTRYGRYNVERSHSPSSSSNFTAQYSLRSTGVHHGNSNNPCTQYTYASTLTIRVLLGGRPVALAAIILLNFTLDCYR